MSLRFGTGGIPLSTKNRSAIEGVRRIRELGLESMELEFVYNIFINEKQAQVLRTEAEKLDVALSVHASYYINLASNDKQKWHASINRIEKSALIGHLAGARYVTFHAGFVQGRSEDTVYPLVKTGIMKVLEYLKRNSLNIKITPELTGKPTQWGDLVELIHLAKDVNNKQLGFCVDFAHQHARSNGKYNSQGEFKAMLDDIADNLGGQFLKDMHIHISGINYSPKGERNHLTLLGPEEEYNKINLRVEGLSDYYANLSKKNKVGPSDLDWIELLGVLKEYKVEGIVVCESPNLEQDALLLQKTYQKL